MTALAVGIGGTPAQAQTTDAAYVMGYFKESLNGSGNVDAVLTPTEGTKGDASAGK